MLHSRSMFYSINKNVIKEKKIKKFERVVQQRDFQTQILFIQPNEWATNNDLQVCAFLHFDTQLQYISFDGHCGT